jgi:DNA-binding NarL/FixJ family response regulator
MSIRLLLLDENALFRKGLAALLSLQTDMLVAGEVGNAKEAEHMSARLEPDVLLMDLSVAGISGLGIAEQLKRRQPQIKVVILTASRTEENVRAALRLGIDGYVLKDATLEELLIAIRSVEKGKKYLSPDVSGHLVESFLHPEQANSKGSQLDVLTNRERGILQLIAEGRTNKSAAEFLCVSPKTVEKHRASLMQKLGLRNATEMTLAAIELGLIERPSSFTRFGAGNSVADS